MEQLPNKGGGDTRTPAAKLAIAQREEQIVALRLRGIPFAAIGRQLGVSKPAAVKAFYRALRRNTDKEIRAYHRSELAELEMEQARIWRALDANKTENWQATAASMAALNRIHIRRAKLLGLDAPTKLDIASIYGSGSDEASVERLQRQRALGSLPVAEQIRWLEMVDEAERRLNEATAAMETTGTMTANGTDHRNDADEDAGREE